jgi:xylose isomerase
MNSFKVLPELYQERDRPLALEEMLSRAATVKGLRSVDLNYPEHFANTDVANLRSELKSLNLTCNGVATRFGSEFVRGDFAHPEAKVRDKALQLADEAAKTCRQMGGNVLTLWFAHDGFDYSFEGDHAARFQRAVSGVAELAKAHSDLNISIEYKPYQPRAFSVFADIGSVLLAIHEMGEPNIGVTLDYCHMLMKRENPSQSLALAQREQKLLGVHLNDGYGDNDDGMMVGSANLLGLLEFIFYLKESQFNGQIYFDTFPDRVDPVAECQANIDTVEAASAWVDQNIDKLREAVESQDPIRSQRIVIDILSQAGK